MESYRTPWLERLPDDTVTADVHHQPLYLNILTCRSAGWSSAATCPQSLVTTATEHNEDTRACRQHY